MEEGLQEEELVCQDHAPYRPVPSGLCMLRETLPALATATEQPDLVPCVQSPVQS